SANGYGTCAWNWAISCTLSRYAPPSLPQHTSPQQISRPSHLHKGMDQLQRPCPGKLDASLGVTLFPSQMAPCVAQLGNPCAPTSGEERSMEACVWSMRPASAVVAFAPCGN